MLLNAIIDTPFVFVSIVSQLLGNYFIVRELDKTTT